MAKGIKTPQAGKKYEKEFALLAMKLIESMSKSFRNQTFNQLTKKDVKKFADAKTGNFANVWVQLASQVKRNLLADRFSDERLKKIAWQLLDKSDKDTSSRMYAEVEKAMGISSKQLLSTEGMTITKNAMKLETVEWLKKLRDETLQQWTASTLRSMANGDSLETIMKQFDGLVEARTSHAKMVARTQINSFNSFMTKARAQKLGIKEAIWITSGDERVRRCHQVRDGKKFDLDKGLYSSCDGKHLLPAVDYNCRCTYELVLPE